MKKRNRVKYYVAESYIFNMVFPQVIAGFHTVINIIGLPGNLLVIVTIALERRFHVMRYILLASLAVSDILFLILVNSFRIASTAQERWLYGQTMCDVNALFMRYFYLNTVLHLIAVSYERYKAIVKSPMTYDGTITKSRVMFIALIWIVPIPFSIGPFLGWGKYVYNPEVFYCDQGWAVKGDISAMGVIFYVLFSFVAPFCVIVFLNWRVFKTARTLQRNVVAVQLESLADIPESQLHVISRRMRERKAAVDVSIIIAAFLLCYLPAWITGICRQFVKSIKVPAEVILATACIFIFSSVCNPIIYSIRKKEFRTGVKNVLKRMGACRCSNDINDNVRNTRDARLADQTRSEAFVLRRSITRETLDAQNHNRGLFGSTENVVGLSFRRICVSPIQEITE
ncbi:octopamine receptor beta-1R-like [Oculina patagonica]